MILILIWISLVLGFLTLAFKTYMEGNDDFWPKMGVPVVPASVIGKFWDRITFKIPFHELDARIYQNLKSYGGGIRFGGFMEFRRPVAFLLDLDLIKHVMVKDFDHFTNRRQFGRKDDESMFDKMLFSMDNPEWKDLRATLSPTFSTGKIRRMFEVFQESSRKMTEFLNTETKKSQDIDLRDVCGRYTMDVIASAAFGVDSQNFKDKNSQFAVMGNRVQNQFTSWLALAKLFIGFLIPSISTFFRFNTFDLTVTLFFKDVVQKVIKHRDATGEKRNDFLQLLMECRSGGDSGEIDDQKAAAAAAVPDVLDAIEKESQAVTLQQKAKQIHLTDDLIVAQCILFFIAGFDTTETLLIYAAYELALNPDIQDKLVKEIEAAAGEKGVLDYDVVNQLEYLEMVITETLRKYPPVSRTERKCVKDYQVPGSKIVFKKGQIVSAPVYSIHHDPEYYPEPDKFIPERFSKENKNQRNPYTWMPFGVGPRNCIAMRFALTEGKAAIAHLIHNFELRPTTRTTIPMKFLNNGAMKPIDGMWLKVIPRH